MRRVHLYKHQHIYSQYMLIVKRATTAKNVHVLLVAHKTLLLLVSVIMYVLIRNCVIKVYYYVKLLHLSSF